MASNRKAALVEVGVVGSAADVSLDERLLVIDRSIEAWLDRHSPDVVAVERVFSQLNVSTVMGTAQASGIVIAAAARRGIAVALHTPTEVKAAVTGNGQADKAAVAKMVTKILGLDEAPRPADAADALALAITHAWRRHVPGAVVSGGGAGAAGALGAGRAPRAGGGAGGATGAQQRWADAARQAKQREKELALRARRSRDQH